jgi:hypothetical protein
MAIENWDKQQQEDREAEGKKKFDDQQVNALHTAPYLPVVAQVNQCWTHMQINRHCYMQQRQLNNKLSIPNVFKKHLKKNKLGITQNKILRYSIQYLIQQTCMATYTWRLSVCVNE